jgi:hypothetical protein
LTTVIAPHVEEPPRYIFKKTFLYTLLNDFITRLHLRMNEWPPPIPVRRRIGDSRRRCVSSPQYFFTTFQQPQQRRVGLGVGVQRMGRLQPPQYVFLFTFLYILLDDFFILDYVYDQTNGHLHHHTNTRNRAPHIQQPPPPQQDGWGSLEGLPKPHTQRHPTRYLLKLERQECTNHALYQNLERSLVEHHQPSPSYVFKIFSFCAL